MGAKVEKHRIVEQIEMHLVNGETAIITDIEYLDEGQSETHQQHKIFTELHIFLKSPERREELFQLSKGYAININKNNICISRHTLTISKIGSYEEDDNLSRTIELNILKA